MTHSSSATRQELIELGATEQIELGPLDRDEDHRLVGELLHLDDDLAAQVVERTAGNPLFALQLVGDWVRRRVLVASRDGFVPAEDASLDLPDDIHTLWRGRLSEALAGRRREFREALAVAAALGADVDHGLWTAAAPLPPERLEELAGLLLEHGLATPTPRGFAFVHGMARESILRSAAERGDAPRIHGRCADAMSALGDPASVAQRDAPSSSESR